MKQITIPIIGNEPFPIEVTVRKDWGYEKWFMNNELYCGKELYIKSRAQSSKGKFHYHKIKDETFFILGGKLILDYFFKESVYYKTVTLTKNCSFRIIPEMRHRFKGGILGCKFIEVSTHHEDSDSYYDDQLKAHDVNREILVGG